MAPKRMLVCLAALLCLALAGAAYADHHSCKSNQDCGYDNYCEKPIGKCTSEGECKERPEVCTDEFDPVCGCDGHTYSNACQAASAGVSIAAKGKCERDGDATSPCLTNEDCNADLFCDKPDGACKGPGICAPRPQICPQIFDPVCGCDLQTYSNSCFANSSGISVLYEGECSYL